MREKKGIISIFDEIVAFIALAIQVALIYVLSWGQFLYLRVINYKTFAFLIASLSAPILAYFVRLVIKIITRKKLIGLGFGVLAVVGSLLIPSVFISLAEPFDSYTTDIKNYGKYDEIVRDDGLFPDSVPSKESLKEGYKLTYYYHHTYSLDPAYDIYAEWYLTEYALAKEITRIENLFKSFENDEWLESAVVEHGDFICYILHEKGSPIFEPLEDCFYSFDYKIFAYNQETGQVRYIVTYCMDIVDETPYYLKLVW